MTQAIAPRRTSFALVMTLLLLTLILAISARLATVVSTEAIVASRRARGLAHELAVDSALLVLADRLGASRQNPYLAELDRAGQTEVAFEIGEMHVTCLIKDDGGKFNPQRYSADHQRGPLERKLAMLGAGLRLPSLDIRLRPVVGAPGASATSGSYRWYDQLFADVQPGDLFPVGMLEHSSRSMWCDAVTFWGDGRVDLRRVSPQVLEAALEDLRPGLARAILARRKAGAAANALEDALIAVEAEIRQEVASRLTYDARRYAVQIETARGADRRHWYVVATIDGKRSTVHHRSQVLW